MITNHEHYDCHGGPGTTEPACGACITCLLRRIDLLQAAGSELRACAANIGYTSSENVTWIRRAEKAVNDWDELNPP